MTGYRSSFTDARARASDSAVLRLGTCRIGGFVAFLAERVDQGNGVTLTRNHIPLTADELDWLIASAMAARDPLRGAP